MRQIDDPGFWRVRNVLTPAEVDLLRQRLAHYEENPEQYATPLEFEYEPGAEAVRKMRRLPWVDLEPWSRLWENDSVQELLRGRFGAERVGVAYCAAFLKPAAIGTRTPFHQDQALWTRTLPGAISCWTALDRADERNGCLIMCAGSHVNGVLQHDEPPGGGHPEVTRSILETLPKEPVPLEPGEAVAWDRLVVHGSAENASSRPRRGVVTVYAPARLLAEDDPVARAPA